MGNQNEGSMDDTPEIEEMRVLEFGKGTPTEENLKIIQKMLITKMVREPRFLRLSIELIAGLLVLNALFEDKKGLGEALDQFSSMAGIRVDYMKGDS